MDNFCVFGFFVCASFIKAGFLTFICGSSHFQIREKNSAVCCHRSADCCHIHTVLRTILDCFLRRLLHQRRGTNL